MKRRSVLFFAALVAASVAAAGIVACTEELSVGAEARDGASGTSTTLADGAVGGGGGTTVTDGAAMPDANASPPPDNGGCGIVRAQEGAVVAIQTMHDAPPQGAGGAIAAGVYVLTRYRVHGAGPQGTGNVRETLVVTGSPTAGAFAKLSDLSETTGDFTAHGPLGEHFTFMGAVGSPELFVSEDCPTDDPDHPIGFTASSNSLTLFDDFVFTERVYTKIR